MQYQHPKTLVGNQKLITLWAKRIGMSIRDWGTTGSDMIATVNCHRYAKQSSAELIAEGAIS